MPLSVSMYTPWRAQCGISDYSRWLVEALRSLPEIEDLDILEAREAEPAGGLGSLLRYAKEERIYRELAREARGGLIHIQHQYFFFGGVAPHKNHARAFLNGLRVPAVMTVHEIAGASPSTTQASQTSFVVQQAVNWTNRANFLHPRIRALIVHTSTDREVLVRLGARADIVHHLPHPVPLAAAMPSHDVALRRWGLEGKRCVMLFGFLANKKGHALALDMMSHLPPDVVLLFAGGQHPQDHTDYVPRLRARIANEGLFNRVRITDYLAEADIPGIMAATDVAIAPFLQSSGSGSLANLFAYGRAVVASDIPPHREIAQEHPAPMALFPSGDAVALAEQVNSLLDLTHPARRNALQSASYEYAQRHSYLEMARSTAQIYRSVVTSS